jgi:hypothetical protein
MALLQRDAERTRLMCPDAGNPLSARRFSPNGRRSGDELR